MGHVGVGWVGTCRGGVGWGVSCRAGVGWVGHIGVRLGGSCQGFEGMCMSNEKFLKPSQVTDKIIE